MSIRLYAKKESGLAGATTSSTLVVNKFSFLNIGGKRSSVNISDSRTATFNNAKKPADPAALGQMLGEFVKNIHPLLPFNKVTGTYPITDFKKELGQIHIELGLFADNEFSIMPSIKPEFKELASPWSFGLLTKCGVVIQVLTQVLDMKIVEGTTKDLKVKDAVRFC